MTTSTPVKFFLDRSRAAEWQPGCEDSGSACLCSRGGRGEYEVAPFNMGAVYAARLTRRTSSALQTSTLRKSVGKPTKTGAVKTTRTREDQAPAHQEKGNFWRRLKLVPSQRVPLGPARPPKAARILATVVNLFGGPNAPVFHGCAFSNPRRLILPGRASG
eukprot:IDg22292t1